MARSSESAATCAIAVMAKASIPGLTKTRLTPHVSPEDAAQLNTSFLRDVAANIIAASTSANIVGVMAHAPKGSAGFFRATMPEAIELVETVAPDFGGCLKHAARELLDAGHESVCLLNSDSPTLPTAYLIAAATALSATGDRIVLGPSTDGGYYLLGLKTLHRRLFEDIDWSTERVAAQTLARARELGLPVVMLPTWYDVDDIAALNILADELFRSRPFRACGHRANPAIWSRRELERLLTTTDLGRKLHVTAAPSRVA